MLPETWATTDRISLPRMLYDFHCWQNGKNTGAVHATYMIYGIKNSSQTNGHSQRDGDEEMTSSPPESAPQVEEVPLMTLSLVAEDNLSSMQYRPISWGCLADLLQQVSWLNTSRSHPSMFTALARIQ